MVVCLYNASTLYNDSMLYCAYVFIQLQSRFHSSQALFSERLEPERHRNLKPALVIG